MTEPGDSFFQAILINTRPVKDKDYVHTFLTEEGLCSLMEYGGQKNGSKTFKLFSQGTVFAFKYKDNKFASIHDSRAEIVRQNLLDVDKFIMLMPFLTVIKFFANKNVDNFFSLTSEVFDSLNENANDRKIFIYYVEKIFDGLGFSTFYEQCPLCEKIFDSREILGYNMNINSPVCENCSDRYPFLLPGMRRYLSCINKKTLGQILDIEIQQPALDRVFEYECKRLKFLGLEI